MEVLIDNDTFTQGLQNKADKLPEELKKLVNAATFAVDTEVKKEPNMPVITGNLQGSISIDNLSDYSKRIFPDEGIAPYAIYVLRGVRGKARVEPKDFLAGGFANAEPAIESAVDEFKSWIME